MTLLVSQVLLWIVVLLLAVAVIALARQVGVLHERIAPVGALAIGRGPQPGDAAPRVAGRTLADTTIEIGVPRPGETLRMLLFVSPTCPICKTLMPTAQAVADHEGVELLLVGDGDAAEHRQMAAKHAVPLDRFINGAEVGRAFHVGKLPYAVLLRADGIIVAQGLVNSREHLESLLVAHETGLRSVQDYIDSRRGSRAGRGDAPRRVGNDA